MVFYLVTGVQKGKSSSMCGVISTGGYRCTQFGTSAVSHTAVTSRLPSTWWRNGELLFPGTEESYLCVAPF